MDNLVSLNKDVFKAPENNKFQFKKPELNIAIIDDFTNKSIFIDNDTTPDIAHGKVIERFIKEGLPNASIREFDIKATEGLELLEGVNNQLDCMLENIEQKGLEYDALNLSISSNYSFNNLRTVFNSRLSAWGVTGYKEDLRKYIDTKAETPLDEDALSIEKENRDYFITINSIIKKLDKISSKGVKIYVAAGNNSGDFRDNNLNLFSLANGVTTVGSTESEIGTPADFSNYGDIVKKWEKGVFLFSTLKDDKGQEGIDFTQDGSIDIYKKDLSAKELMGGIKGTSLSTPIALVKDFKSKFDTRLAAAKY